MMTITIGDVTPKKPSKPQSAEMDAAAELVRMAREQGLALTGPDGQRTGPRTHWPGWSAQTVDDNCD